MIMTKLIPLTLVAVLCATAYAQKCTFTEYVSRKSAPKGAERQKAADASSKYERYTCEAISMLASAAATDARRLGMRLAADFRVVGEACAAAVEELESSPAEV